MGWRRRRRTATAAALMSVAAVGATIVAPAAQRAGADPSGSAATAVEWNLNAQAAIVGTAAQGPTVAILHFAMVQGAVYDAVNAIEGGYEPYLGAPAMAGPEDSVDAAIAAAAYRVLVTLFPDQRADLDAKLALTLDGIPDGTAEDGGIEVGEAAAAAMLVARADDGRFTAFPVVQGTEPGQWRSTSFLPDGTPVVEPAPWVGNVDPFVIRSAVELRTDGPDPLTSRAYRRDFREVKRVGALESTVRTEDQTEAAIFWQANAAMLYNTMMRQLVDTQELDVVDAARLFAMGDMAGADGAIACWNDKYYWSSWRPVTAIRLADTDGNDATVADPEWAPLFSSAPPLVTPAFPEHPSGHACVSGAIVETLKDFFGTGKVGVSLFSPLTNTTREFTRLSKVIHEVIDARVWAGIHFRTADQQGYGIGKKVARQLDRGFFGPVD